MFANTCLHVPDVTMSLETSVSIYVRLRCHDVTSWRHSHCNSLRFSLRKFWISKNRPADTKNAFVLSFLHVKRVSPRWAKQPSPVFIHEINKLCEAFTKRSSNEWILTFHNDTTSNPYLFKYKKNNQFFSLITIWLQNVKISRFFNI